MTQTYTRQSSFSDGDTITAALFNDEYNQLVNAFAYSTTSSSTGHQHDGSTAEGGNIHTIGDLDFLNKIVADSTNNRWGVFVEVSSAAVEQIRIQDGAIVPVTDNDIDLGTSSAEFKDAYFDGTVTTDGLTVSSTTNLDGAIQVDNTITVGVDDTGYDVKFFGDTASAYMLWDTSTDDLVLAGAAGLDIAGDIDVDGTTNLDVVDIDGAVDMASTLAVAGALTGSSTIQGTTITATTAFVPDASDGAALGTSALEFSDLFLADGAVINFGDDQDVSLTHVADTGLLLSSTDQLQFGDSGTYIHQSADGVLDLVSDTEIEINATTIDINGAADISGNLAVGGNLTVTGTATIAGNLTFGDAASDTVAFSADVASNLLPSADNTYDLGASGSEWKDLYLDGTANIDSLVADTADINGGTVDGATIGASSASSGAFTTITASSSITGSSTVQGTTITATTAFVPDASDGAALGTSALEFSDLFLADGAVINFGDDQDVSLTHVADTGLLLSSTDQLQFGDSGTYIHQSADGVLDLVSDTEIELTATTIDINGAVAMDGAMTGGTNITISGELDAATLDISGNADIDGTLEADAYTVDGTALNEYIADTIGAMVGSNTETGITVTYEDGDNTLDFVIGTLNQDTTGTADNITISANNSTDETVYPIFVDGATGSQGAESDTGLTYNPSSGLLTSTLFAGTLNTAAQANVTSLGTLSALTVSGNLSVDGGTIKLDGNHPTGTANVALGNTALDSLTTGVDNTAIGDVAGTAITEGINNTLIGAESGDATTDADHNTAVGFRSLSTNTVGSRSVAVGAGALFTQNPSTATDMYNVGVGYEAGVALTTGIKNTFIGGIAGDATTTANSNTAVGYAALTANTTGADNVAIGNEALAANTTASNNTAVGNDALLVNTTAANNTAVGASAGAAITTGLGNTFVGSLAGDATDDGTLNTAVGYAALSANCGDSNVAVGTGALEKGTASNNTAVGRAALTENTTGAGNAAVGT